LFCSDANHHPRDELIRKVAKPNELLILEQVQRPRIRLAIIELFQSFAEYRPVGFVGTGFTEQGEAGSKIEIIGRS